MSNIVVDKPDISIEESSFILGSDSFDASDVEQFDGSLYFFNYDLLFRIVTFLARAVLILAMPAVAVGLMWGVVEVVEDGGFSVLGFSAVGVVAVVIGWKRLGKMIERRPHRIELTAGGETYTYVVPNKRYYQKLSKLAG